MIDFVLGILFPFLFFPIFISQYLIIQSEHYELEKYFIYERKKKIVYFLLSLILTGLSFFKWEYIFVFLIPISFAISNTFFVRNMKVKITPRIKRVFLIYFIEGYILYFLFNSYKILLYVSNFILVYIALIHYISTLLEKVIRIYYKKEAKKKIKGKKVIGITGSYGKTSCKNIIYDMLSEIHNVSKTPKSFNTEIGIIKSIRENVDVFDDYFICEYGVDKVNGMNKLINIVKPNICLITEVGPQHLLTFKNIENIRKEKIKLAKSLNSDEKAVINIDNEYLRMSLNELQCKYITYGIKGDSYITAKNIKATNEGSVFDLYIDNKKIDNITIKLLGEYNVSNVLGAIGVLIAIGVPIIKIVNLIQLIKPVEHRLQLKTINNVRVIDDSFNSNKSGFEKAVNVLNNMAGKRIIITPGIIEQGKNSYSLNYNLAKHMVGKIDVAVLVEKNAVVLKKGLVDNGFNERNITIKKNFLEAWEHVKKIEGDKIVLIENDLPSIYLK